MIRSKFIPITLATFCGLALQFQASGANAQTGTTFVGGTNVTQVGEGGSNARCIGH